jgi:hypothetical protein
MISIRIDNMMIEIDICIQLLTRSQNTLNRFGLIFTKLDLNLKQKCLIRIYQ